MISNQLRLFKSTINHEPSEEILFYANFTEGVENRLRQRIGLDKNISLAEYFGMYRPVDVSLKPPPGYKRPDYRKYYEDIDIPPGAFINGLGVLEIPGSSYHFTRYVSPLRNADSISELEKFDYPNVDGFTDDHMAAEVDSIHKRNMVACCYISHMYEDAWQIRGYEQFLMDMLSEPEMCDYILDRICERNIKKAEAAAKAGVDLLITGDDVANQRTMMFSIDIWRKFIKSRWAKVYEAARRIKSDIQIWYHSDGNIEDIIPELIEIGVTILNPVQPECIDPVKIKALYGDKIVIDGTIGTQTTMPFGSVDDVKKAVREMREKLGYDGALILSPTHVLEPEVPLDNIMAFIEECSQSR
jgi:uroporphyrinogen decarboxylase